MRRVFWAAVLLSVAMALTPRRGADACAPAPPPGVRVAIAHEEALIVWDAAAHVEHFIRRASFETAAREFGFLVPTPSVPTLSEVPERIFPLLDEVIAPAVEVVHETSGVAPGCSCAMLMLAGSRSARDEMRSAATAPVRVLHEQRVAGYDAVVLEADDPAALARWLAEHGYESRPALAEWLTPYVNAHWKLTAFRIAPSEGGDAGVRPIASSVVRMSFATERPFFPYREPADQREAGAAGASRLLRVFFVSDARYEGTLGENGRWPGTAKFSNAQAHLGVRLSEPAVSELLPRTPWLTAFEDSASPRPGTDEVFFKPSRDRSPVIPPPVRYVTSSPLTVPVDWIVVPSLFGYWLWRRRRKRASPR